MSIVYKTATLLFAGALRVWSNWEVEGAENVPKTGPLIIVANHLGIIDSPLLAVCIPRRIEFMAKAELFHNPITSVLLRSGGAFPIAENGREFHSIKHSLAILQREGTMGIFPEGGRTQTSLGKAMLGAAMIAIKSGAPVLPVGITGTEGTISLVKMAMPTGTFGVRIGEPFKPPPIYGNKLRGNLEKVTDIIMERIAEVLPENYRGLYDGSIGHGHHEYTSPQRWGT